jgi:CARDB protein
MARRAIALGVGLVVLILLVLGIRGCLDARKERSLKDYARDVSQIAAETERTSENFFGRLQDPENLSTQEFLDAVNTDRSAMDGYLARVEGLSTPGDMERAQNALELVYQLRSNALTEIANQLPTALGDAGREQAITRIAEQMRILLASDVLYEDVVTPEINQVLADNDITDSDVSESQFVQDGIKWLDEDAIDTALSGISGVTASATPGLHGTELVSVSVNGTTLDPSTTASVEAGDAPEVEASILNGGDSEETEVEVSVTVDDEEPLTGDIPSIVPGATEVVTIPLTPAPEGEVTLEVQAEPVPGEEKTDNNSASYTVDFV